MTTQHHLNSEQRHILKRLSSHPLATDIKWSQVLALVTAMGEVRVESGGRYRVTVGDHTEVFTQPGHLSDVSAEMVMRLRHFLGAVSHTTAPSRGGRHLLVVVDHHGATVYDCQPPSRRVAAAGPFDPNGRLRHLHHIEGHYQGQRAPEDVSYYRAVAAAIRGAQSVVIFGHGDGHSDSVGMVRTRLKEHLSTPAPNIVEVRLDARSYTEPQLLVAAQRVFSEMEEGEKSDWVEER